MKIIRFLWKSQHRVCRLCRHSERNLFILTVKALSKDYLGGQGNSEMGTSSRGSANNKNVSYGRSVQTESNKVASSPRPALIRKEAYGSHADTVSEINFKSRLHQPATSARSARQSFNRGPGELTPRRSTKSHASITRVDDPSGCLSPGRGLESHQRIQDRVMGGYPLGRPTSAAAAGTDRSLLPSRPGTKLRPHSSVTARSCFPATTTPSHPQLGRTLDDLPMQHTQEDALNMLQRRRAETAAQHRVLRQQGGEIKMVSNFSRRMFDSAVSNRGQGPAPPPSPSEAAVLFFRESKPSWGSLDHRKDYVPTDSGRLVARPQSMTAGQSLAILSTASPKKRPDSEPPSRWHTDREFNHLRHHRQMYPHINRLVNRYNEDMRVVCNQSPEVCEKRRNSRDFSVASEFYLVPLRQDEVIEVEGKETDVTTKEEPKKEEDEIVFAPSGEDESNLQQEIKAEDQLAAAVSRHSPGSIASSERDQAAVSETNRSEEQPSPPWRCWVDDATVSTVHSRPASIATADGEAAEDASPSAPSALKKTISEKESSPSANKLAGSHPGEAPTKTPSPTQPAPTQKDKKGRKKKEEALPEPPSPPPPPVEEPPIVVEELVEEEESQPEPEPVPPPYICPSSESKSQHTEIRRWLQKSPFRAATRTMPIF